LPAAILDCPSFDPDLRNFGWESFAFGFGPRRFGFWGPRHGRRQWFGSGDMKYVILNEA